MPDCQGFLPEIFVACICIWKADRYTEVPFTVLIKIQLWNKILQFRSGFSYNYPFELHSNKPVELID